jgi:nicotinate phosphoribosyltransferase
MPTNNLVRALLTDMYQITMSYAHWKMGKHNDDAVFELFFRKNPFKGEYTIFCGLDECLKHIQSFAFTQDDIDYLKSIPSLAHCEDDFFDDYLLNLTTTALKVYAIPEGTVVFPREPLLILEGPLGIGQLLETTLLNLINYPSLIATNASRMVLRAGSVPCFEFGLRRAQGPDGACSASKYSYVGGFMGTSNVEAGKIFGIPIAGTHARTFCGYNPYCCDFKETTEVPCVSYFFLVYTRLQYPDIFRTCLVSFSLS